MIQSRVIMIASVIGIAGALLLKQRGPADGPEREALGQSTSVSVPQVPTEKIFARPAVQAAGPLAQGQSESNSVREVTSVSRKEFPHARQIAEYSEFKSKIFPSDSEKRERSRLIRDTSFLKSLEGLLRTPDRIGEDDLQAVAIEILMEAWADAKARPVAEEVMKAIVADPRIEDPALDLRSREVLAANKGELIFHWTSLDPGKMAEIRAWMPGPVSERILQNVRSIQDRNLAESAHEARYSAGIEQ
jgi:hypothetical protein